MQRSTICRLCKQPVGMVSELGCDFFQFLVGFQMIAQFQPAFSGLEIFAVGMSAVLSQARFLMPLSSRDNF